ncbi:MAG TPA: hypothetical protein PK718_01115 [Candidatus Methanofastidiosa archaeon]|nr:hypothetical protein [Candidatus Methanofastidiosa archaeon]
MRRLGLCLVLIIISFSLIYVGAMEQDVKRSRNISSALCLACLGITNTFEDKLIIDDLTRIQYSGIDNDVTIYIYSTETCTTCPHVIEMCEEMEKFSDRITVEEIKLEEDEEKFYEMANEYGVEVSQGVPWITIDNGTETITWRYEEYLDGYPKNNDPRFITQVIDMVIKFGTA